MKKRILFYASTSDISLFLTKSFYSINIELLKDIGYHVIATNKMLPFLRKNEYDIAFLYFFKKSFFPCFIARILGKKIYITGGLDELNRESTIIWKYIRQCIFFTGCYLFSTKSLIESNSDLKNIYKILHKDIYNKLVFFPMCLAKNIENFKFGLKNKTVFSTICWFGDGQINLLRKGVDKALKVFAELIKIPEYKNSCFYIVGKNGRKNKHLAVIINKLCLHENIIITDEISTNDKYEILSKSKYYFQLSKYEGFGLAALEALYFENIVIHSNKGGLSDFLMKYGIIYDENTEDIKQLYAKMSSFDENCFKEAKDNIMQHYTYNIRKNKLLEIIE